MRARRFIAATAATVLVASGAVLAGASSASAADSDQIWYQSVGSPSETAPCPESEAADLTAGWTPWVKGYEAWPNGGKGGWTCGRSILWAKGEPPTSAGSTPASNCIMAIPGSAYLDYGSGNALGPDVSSFVSSSCTGELGPLTGAWFVYATTLDGAQAICDVVSPTNGALQYGGGDASLYYCIL